MSDINLSLPPENKKSRGNTTNSDPKSESPGSQSVHTGEEVRYSEAANEPLRSLHCDTGIGAKDYNTTRYCSSQGICT